MFLKKLFRPAEKPSHLPLPPAPHRPALPRAITHPETPISRRSQEVVSLEDRATRQKKPA